MRRRTRNAVAASLREARTLAARSPNERFELMGQSTVVPAVLGEAICLVALEANIPVRNVVTAMLAYGVEAFARELRATNYAPQPRLPVAHEAQQA